MEDPRSPTRMRSEVVEVDRISDLSDSVIQHILSFIPTKDAVRTSVLSKRWKNTWIGVPVVDISFEELEEDVIDETYIQHFINFMDRLLLLHDGCNIDKFRLEFSFSCASVRVKSWLSMLLMRHSVKDLDLDIKAKDDDEDETLVIPKHYFASPESLMRMRFHLYRVAQVPISVCMLNLKELLLREIQVSCDEDFPQQPFVMFPNLEKLHLCCCHWKTTTKTVRIYAPKLRTLYIEDLELEDDYKIKVHAPSVTSFTFEGVLLEKYYLYSLSSLDNASINAYDCDANERYIIKFLTSISEVKNLWITGGAIHRLCDEVDSIPTFVNLTILNVANPIGLRTYTFITFLRALPNLESLIFTDGVEDLLLGEHDEIVAAMFPFFPLRVKTIEVGMFHGGKHELDLIKLFLGNARCLEIMTIKSSQALLANDKKRMEVTGQLLMFPRGSTRSMLNLS